MLSSFIQLLDVFPNFFRDLIFNCFQGWRFHGFNSRSLSLLQYLVLQKICRHCYEESLVRIFPHELYIAMAFSCSCHCLNDIKLFPSSLKSPADGIINILLHLFHVDKLFLESGNFFHTPAFCMYCRKNVLTMRTFLMVWAVFIAILWFILILFHIRKMCFPFLIPDIIGIQFRIFHSLFHEIFCSRLYLYQIRCNTK